MAGVLLAEESRREIVNSAPTSFDDAKPNSDKVPDVYPIYGKISRVVIFRFKNDTDLLAGMEKMIKQEKIKNAVILSAADSLKGYQVHQISNRDFPSKNMFVGGFGLEPSLREMLPYTVFISLKDSRGKPWNPEFLLAGDGETDYAAYFRLLGKLGYNGFVSIEVSSMIQRKPGYDPIAAARLCYGRLAPVFGKAGIKRRRT